MGSPPSPSVRCLFELVGSCLPKPLWVTLLWLGPVSFLAWIHPLLLLPGLPFLLVFGWIDLSHYTCCSTGSSHLTACSVSGWVITSQIQTSLNLVYDWLGSQSQFVALLLALQTLCVILLTHLFALSHLLWIPLRCLSHPSCPLDPLLLRLEIPGHQSLLPFRPVRAIGWWLLIALLVQGCLGSQGSNVLGWQVAGQEQLVRAGLDLPIRQRPLNCRTGIGAWSSVSTLLDRRCSPHREHSLRQLDVYKGPTLSVTASLLRRRQGCTLRPPRRPIPRPSIRSNGWCQTNHRQLSALCAGDVCRGRGGWSELGNGALCCEKRVRCTFDCPKQLFPRGGVGWRANRRTRRFDWSIHFDACSRRKARSNEWVTSCTSSRFLGGCRGGGYEPRHIGSAHAGCGVQWSNRALAPFRCRPFHLSSSRRSGVNDLGLAGSAFFSGKDTVLLSRRGGARRGRVGSGDSGCCWRCRLVQKLPVCLLEQEKVRSLGAHQKQRSLLWPHWPHPSSR